MYMEDPTTLVVGDNVKEYQYLGKVVNTGRSEGEYLHYQIE